MQSLSPIEPNNGTINEATLPDDLAREVYGLLGIPIDAIDMAIVLRRIETAAARPTPFLISTANLNFLVTSRSDAQFRESLLLSDLCTADGMPIVWIARLLGIPIKDRIAGADIFEALKCEKNADRLKVFFFGGEEGAAAAACKMLNSDPSGLTCAGSYYPGYETVDKMSTDVIINTINSSNANFLVAALGAKKGQAWLLQNHGRLRIPVRVHLGAVVNFQAGSVKRAPARMREWGLEWLWRIKEEPQLWTRYWGDGLVLLKLMLARVVPLLLLTQWYRLRWSRKKLDLVIRRSDDHKTVTLSLNGAATIQNVGKTVPYFRDATAAAKDVVINCSNICLIDTRFLGLLLMLNKQLMRRRLWLRFDGVSSSLAKLFRLNGFGYLLNT